MKRRDLKIALIQIQSRPGETKANLEKAISFIQEAAENGAQIVCLPELFYTSYYISSEEFQKLAEPVDGYFVKSLCKVAKENSIYIIAGYAESVNIPGRIYNSAIFIDDKGEVVGNMQKVYAYGEEKLKFREGHQFPVYRTPLGNIGIMICYDSEFPEPSRIMALKGAEIVFVLSLWSTPNRWDLVLAANALFNNMFLAGVNSVKDVACGRSQIVGPDALVRAMASETEEEILYCDIDLNDVIAARSKWTYLNDLKEDTFSIEALVKY